MKGLILSGGKGTRLRPITHTSAKQLVPIANKPVLFYAIEAIRDAGITDIGIVVGDTRAEIMEAVGDGSAWKVKTTFIHQEEPLGLAHAVKVSRDYLQKDPFVMFLGDNLIKDGITPLVREFQRNQPNSQILLAKVRDPQRFGVAELQNGKVVRLEEKPKQPKSDLALVGVYMFDHNIFTAVEAIKPSFRGELEITDAIQYLIDQGYTVEPHVISGWWKDTGKLEDILEANRMMLEDLETKIEGESIGDSHFYGKVQLGKGTKVINSVLRGPVIIGQDCDIVNAYVGPFTSINDRVIIKNSEVEHSIILEDSKIIDLEGRLEDSLLGKEVEIYRTDHKPKAFRFMLGDHSRVGII